MSSRPIKSISTLAKQPALGAKNEALLSFRTSRKSRAR
jgi:hypothetical protein